MNRFNQIEHRHTPYGHASIRCRLSNARGYVKNKKRPMGGADRSQIENYLNVNLVNSLSQVDTAMAENNLNKWLD